MQVAFFDLIEVIPVTSPSESVPALNVDWIDLNGGHKSHKYFQLTVI